MTGPLSHPGPYMANRFAPRRRRTLEVRVGNRVIGGEHPVLVQSMTTTPTKDVEATVFQTLELWRAGCELVRITAPTQKDAECLQEIVRKVRAAGCDAPISADIHFQPRAAFEAVKWVEKVRINPGNFVDSKSATPRLYDDASFEQGRQKAFEAFVPLVRAAKERGVCLRIGTNHGSLSDRMLWKYGDTIEGMVESALEYLRICESENFDQIVFSMKSSNPRVVVQAYRLLAARLDRDHKPYPFHVGVTEAGDGEDGRLKSSVGIGALLLDGLGDTVRVSLTEDPEHEIPVAKALVRICDTSVIPALPVVPETLDPYAYVRRDADPVDLPGLSLGGRESVAVGIPAAAKFFPGRADRKVEWQGWRRAEDPAVGAKVWEGEGAAPDGAAWTRVRRPEDAATAVKGGALEVVLSSIDALKAWEGWHPTGPMLWSFDPAADLPRVGAYRTLAAWLAHRGWQHPILLRHASDGSSEGNMRVAAEMGSLFCDGVGDALCVEHAGGSDASLNLAYDVLQAAGVRKSKPEYVACPSCGRTLFDLQTTTQTIRARTAHLREISIAVMGCIVNGPGEMADADFGYVGGAPGKVNLYVGRECVQRNIPEAQAPQALVDLIKAHGRWREPAAETESAAASAEVSGAAATA